jgi:hypothetical protein
MNFLARYAVVSWDSVSVLRCESIHGPVSGLYHKCFIFCWCTTNAHPVVVKTPADFVGSVLGGSEANTKAILASTVGKVLIIDGKRLQCTNCM